MKTFTSLLIFSTINSLSYGGQWNGLFDHVQSVGGQIYQSVSENLQEARDIAQVLTGDAKDAFKTVKCLNVFFFPIASTWSKTTLIPSCLREAGAERAGPSFA